MPRSPRYFGTETNTSKLDNLRHSRNQENTVSKLHEAIKNNKLGDVMAICASLNLDNQKTSIDTWNLINEIHEGYTALQFAALYGRADIVAYLLSQKASLVKQNAAGMDALMCAVAKSPDNSSFKCTRKNKHDILELFLKDNPQFGNLDNGGKNVLFCVVEEGDCEAFEMLLQLEPAKLNAMLSLKVKVGDVGAFIDLRSFIKNTNIVESNKNKMLASLDTKQPWQQEDTDPSDAELPSTGGYTDIDADAELEAPSDHDTDDDELKLPSPRFK